MSSCQWSTKETRHANQPPFRPFAHPTLTHRQTDRQADWRDGDTHTHTHREDTQTEGDSSKIESEWQIWNFIKFPFFLILLATKDIGQWTTQNERQMKSGKCHDMKICIRSCMHWPIPIVEQEVYSDFMAKTKWEWSYSTWLVHEMGCSWSCFLVCHVAIN